MIVRWSSKYYTSQHWQNELPYYKLNEISLCDLGVEYRNNCCTKSVSEHFCSVYIVVAVQQKITLTRIVEYSNSGESIFITAKQKKIVVRA